MIIIIIIIYIYIYIYKPLKKMNNGKKGKKKLNNKNRVYTSIA